MHEIIELEKGLKKVTIKMDRIKKMELILNKVDRLMKLLDQDIARMKTTIKLHESRLSQQKEYLSMLEQRKKNIGTLEMVTGLILSSMDKEDKMESIKNLLRLEKMVDSEVDEICDMIIEHGIFDANHDLLIEVRLKNFCYALAIDFGLHPKRGTCAKQIEDNSQNDMDDSDEIFMCDVCQFGIMKRNSFCAICDKKNKVELNGKLMEDIMKSFVIEMHPWNDKFENHSGPIEKLIDGIFEKIKHHGTKIHPEQFTKIWKSVNKLCLDESLSVEDKREKIINTFLSSFECKMEYEQILEWCILEQKSKSIEKSNMVEGILTKEINECENVANDMVDKIEMLKEELRIDKLKEQNVQLIMNEVKIVDIVIFTNVNAEETKMNNFKKRLERFKFKEGIIDQICLIVREQKIYTNIGKSHFQRRLKNIGYVLEMQLPIIDSIEFDYDSEEEL